MGYLKLLELENFKSYKGVQTIGPFMPFTAVVGPNGSGIRSQQLRGNQIKDMIFTATLIDDHNVGLEDDHKSSKDVEHDNRTRVTAIYHDDDEDKDIHFQRTVHGNSSTYSLNGKVVSWEQYDRVLKGIGLLSKAKNFLVFQGDIENVASKSPRELTQLFEQISHSDSFKADYDELKAAHEKSQQMVIFNFQRKKGITAERRLCKEQKEEAERFQKLIEERAQIKMHHMLWQLFHAEKELRSANEEHSKLTAVVEKRTRTSRHAEEQLKAKKREAAGLHKREQVMDKELKKREQDVAKIRPKYIKAREAKKRLVRKLLTDEEALNKAQSINDTHIDEVKDLEAELRDVSRACESYEKQIKEQQSVSGAGANVVLAEAQFDEYGRLQEEANRNTIELRGKVEKAQRLQASEKEALDAAMGQRDDLLARKKQEEDVCKQLSERAEKLDVHLSRTQAEVKRLIEKRDGLNSMLRQVNFRHQEVTQKLEDTQMNLRHAKSDKHTNERERKLNESLSGMKRLFKGVHGRLFDICHPKHRKYNVAVTVLMGKFMDAIVVDTEKTARECIQYMKEQHSCTATFLPLDTIQADNINEQLRSLGGTARLAVDCVTADASVMRAVHFSLGNSLIFDGLTEARSVCLSGNERHKGATLDGTVLRKSGLMVGGKSDAASRAHRWDSQEVDAMKLSRDVYIKELSELSRQRRKESEEQALTSQIMGLETRLKFSTQDRELTSRKLAHNSRDIKEVEDELMTLEPDLFRLEKAYSSRSSEVAKLLRQVHSAVDIVFVDFCEQLGVENIREYEEKQLRVTQEHAKRRSELNNQHSLLTSQLEYERGRNTAGSLLKAEEVLSSDRAALSNLETELKTMKAEVDKLTVDVENVHTGLASIKQKLSDVNTESSELRDLLTEHGKELRQAQRSLSTKEAECSQLRTKRYELFKKAKMEEITLPILSGNLDDIDDTTGSQVVSMDISDSQSQTLSSSMGGTSVERIELDFDILDEDLHHVSTKDYDSIDAQFEEKLKACSANIDRMAPNMRAIDRLDDVQSRLKDTQGEFDEAFRASKKASKDFDLKKDERYNSFTSCFNHISSVIDKIYKDLTKSAAHPQGGTAYLSLENTEEPYLYGIKYNAMPPMKRFRDMEQLSGGEKTVAALALLFAIHSYQPSPFFIMDEVDAALDNVNVSHVVQYIRKCTQSNFQCIVISLKDTFFEKADALVGVYRHRKDECSRTMTLDLTQYPEEI